MHNLIPWQMILGSALLSFILLCCFWLLDSKCHFTIKPLVWTVIVVVYAVVAYVVAMRYGNHWQGLPLADYSNVYLAALAVADGKGLENEAYFLVYGNNIKPMIILSWLIHLARILGIQNEYYLLLAFTVGSTALALASLVYLLKKDSARIVAAVLFICCIPVWFYNTIFYTDTLSFSTAIISIALLEKENREKEDVFCRWVRDCLLVVVLTIGASIKITAVIPVIAYLVIRVFEKSVSFKRLVVLLCVVALAEAVLTNFYSRYPIHEKAKETENPVISWIGLGLEGDGSWSSGYDYIHNLTALPTKQEKSEFARDYIKQNYKKAFTFDHIVAKTRFNYASGNFGAHGLVTEAQAGKVFREMFDPYGRFYWRTSQICFTYVMALYFIGLFSTIVGMARREKPDRVLLVGYLSFIGMFLFLMLWEANNRQLYNQVPIMILTATLSMRSMIDEKRMAK